MFRLNVLKILQKNIFFQIIPSKTMMDCPARRVRNDDLEGSSYLFFG